MRCLDREGQVTHTRLVPGETQKEHDQESPHIAQSLYMPIPQTPCIVSQWIEWLQHITRLSGNSSKMMCAESS